MAKSNESAVVLQKTQRSQCEFLGMRLGMLSASNNCKSNFVLWVVLW